MKTSSRVLLIVCAVLFASCGTCGLAVAVLSALVGGGNADRKPIERKKADATTQAERSKLLDAYIVPSMECLPLFGDEWVGEFVSSGT